MNVTVPEWPELLRGLVDMWKLRAEHYPDANSDEDDNVAEFSSTHAQLEFFMGVHALLVTLGHPGLPEMFLVMLSVGRNASEFTKEKS